MAGDVSELMRGTAAAGMRSMGPPSLLSSTSEQLPLVHTKCAINGRSSWKTVWPQWSIEDTKFLRKISQTGLPWWRSGWESACQCRGHGFEPRSGNIPHAAEQLGPWATITEPARLEPVLLNKRGRDSERPAHRDEEWPPLAATRESRHTETKTQHSQK